MVVDVALAMLFLAGFGAAALLGITEVSLLRVRASRLRLDAADGDRRAELFLRLLTDLPLVLNTVLFLVLLCQVGVAAISGYLAQRWFGGVWIPVASVAVSILLFVYAESIPKTVAIADPHRHALRTARGLDVVTQICRPVVRSLVSIADLHVRSSMPAPEVVSERELRLLARQAATAGAIASADADLVDRSFEFGDQLVSDVMVHRDRIVALEAKLPVDDALAVALAAGHRRLPIYEHDLDNIVGFVRLRDLAAAGNQAGSGLYERMSTPVFCQPDDSIAQLIERMRASGRWMAIVRGADGATVGLATVEDIVAELMGEIEEPDPHAPRRSYPRA